MNKKVRFVNYSPDGIQKAIIEQDGIDPDDWHFQAEELVAGGVKVSISTNTAGDGICVTFTDKNPKSINKGLIVSAWGSAVGKAFARAYYCIYEAHLAGVTWEEFNKGALKSSNEHTEDYKEFMAWKRSKEKQEGISTDAEAK